MACHVLQVDLAGLTGQAPAAAAAEKPSFSAATTFSLGRPPAPAPRSGAAMVRTEACFRVNLPREAPMRAMPAVDERSRDTTDAANATYCAMFSPPSNGMISIRQASCLPEDAGSSSG